ncbi:MAG: hypothetical protein A3B31_02780 [Candidatus Komeilibacteria bacterium RIFCSPLOWO2_01_FULL_53_11]|uniref:Glycerophosphoryl diester phosphodiesterase membrane domain-containing protein n=1 Tax=Candidatus Komeilibacteria bacterium RIFCSPLOWO2_01_FULL_53_11 TaxID=1798552 RepID=A0A1G2BY26_9BACT|nr:MAG: hypothetical protein A3B31_02780 [Candidatus Komeilibacteria bacterium RIFCSPLOWO2_01_FULL_53_11]
MQTFYRHIIKEAWDLTRKHAFLWPLAFLTSLIGVAGTFQILFDLNRDDSSMTIQSLYTRSDFMTSTFVGWNQSFDTIPWADVSLLDLPFILFFFVLLLVIVAVAIIITSSEGGLIFALGKLQANKTTSYLPSLRNGLDKFWALFSINLIYRLLYLIAIAVVIIPLISVIPRSTPTGTLMLAIIVYFIVIPLIMLLDLVARYSLMYIMLQGNTIRDALYNAWLLFRTNWIISVETAILLLAALFVSVILLSAVAYGVVFLFAMFGAFVAISPAALQIFAVTSIVILILIAAVFVTFFSAMQMSIWVGVFRRINASEHPSKIHRLLRHVSWLHKRIA